MSNRTETTGFSVTDGTSTSGESLLGDDEDCLFEFRFDTILLQRRPVAFQPPNLFQSHVRVGGPLASLQESSK